MHLKHIIPTLGLCACVIISCKDSSKKAGVIEPTSQPVSFTKEGTLKIFKHETDSLLTNLDIEIAESDYEIQTGLMYRNTMHDKQAMLFIFDAMAPRSFYMKNTRFALDIIYLDNELKIVSIQANAQPLNESSLPSGGAAQYVLEVKGGLTKQWGLEKDDYITYNRIN